MEQNKHKKITDLGSPKTNAYTETKKELIPARSELSSGLTAFQYVNEYKKDQARELRKNSTEAEKVLWDRLRNRQICGFKIRRQQPIDGFIADFYCADALLVIEVDGGIHNASKQSEIDQRRMIVFNGRGLLTLRFRNKEVIYDVELCVEEIRRVLRLRCMKAI
jgi:very-short-patch-repair endonuclease